MADTRPRCNAAIILAVIVAILAVAGGLLWLCGCLGGGASTRGERVATILAVNDIYRINGVGANEEGGLHRLRMLRKTIEKETGKVLLLHAGDFLSPSLPSRVFKGEQMIDAMNNLDGDPKKFDARMFVAFGNHEFDDSDCNKFPAPLNARLTESQFTWLNVNLDFSNCSSMKDVPAHRNVKRTAIVKLGGIKFGIFGIGLTPDIKDAKKYPKFGDIYDAARGAIKELKNKKADVIVALTHLDRADDEVLIRSLYKYGLDLLVGGHDHTQMTIADPDGIDRGFKANSDGKSAWLIEVRLLANGDVKIAGKDQKLDDKNQKATRDDAIRKLAKDWSERTEAKICADRKKTKRDPHDKKCLHATAGTADFPINLEEANNRNTETNFGRWIAELVRKETNADVAIVNSGILGLNTNLQKGATLLVEHVVDIFRYDDIVAVREVPAKDVCTAIRHGFSRAGTGAWPHLAGVTAANDLNAPPNEKTELSEKDIEESVRNIRAKWNGKIVFTHKTQAYCDQIKAADDAAAKIDDAETKAAEEAAKTAGDQKIRVVSVPYLLCGGDEYPSLVNKEDREYSGGCTEALKRKPMDKSEFPEGRFISMIAEEAIKEAHKARIGIKAP